MNYPKTKVYFDGSHYIGIPHTTQSWKRRKNKSTHKNDTEEKVKKILKEDVFKTKQEKLKEFHKR